MTKKILYVVHRYPPSAGGSEYYVQAMAEESARRGHCVWVLADYSGELNGVQVRNLIKKETLNEFDLIVVHGADVSVQDSVLREAKNIDAPILYMIIKPSNSPVSTQALRDCAYIGVSTQEDWKHCQTHGVPMEKIVKVRHSLPSKLEDTMVKTIKNVEETPFKKKYGITTKRMFVTAGGFWPHKGMEELVSVFEWCNLEDTTLVCLGYMNPEIAPNSEGNVVSYIVNDRKDVMNAVAEADLYIMNSYEEGFGLVLLEAMANETPWAARHIAGAVELQQYGFTYTDNDQLANYMKNFVRNDQQILAGVHYVVLNKCTKTPRFIQS
jgi:glycosyltransferase involved in cell wall biosynthesis